MNTSISKILKNAVFPAGLAFCLSSCVKFNHGDVPSYPDFELPGNAKVMSIEEIKGYYPGTFDSVGQFREIINGDTLYRDIYIHVVVIGNDMSGNIYKSMYVRDAESGDANSSLALNLAVDKTGLYNFFPLGQELYINCSGLYLGSYEGLPQLGFRYLDDNGSVTLGRIPDVVFMQHVSKVGLPHGEDEEIMKPIEITDASQLDNPALYNQLVILRNVQFSGDDVNLEFAPAPPAGSNPTSTNRYFSINGGSADLILRTSSACRFFRRTVPAGIGDMKSIFAIYGTTKQFYLRAYNDIDTGKFAASAGVNYPVFAASFATGINNFSVYNTDGMDGRDGGATWTWGSYGGGCAMVQGSQTAKTNQDWLVSKEIEIPEEFTAIDLTFEQALSYKYEQPDSYYTVRISTDYDQTLYSDPRQATWSTLTIPNPHPGNNFTFQTSGPIDLSAYRGRKIHIAFVYKSVEGEGMATWEVNKVQIIGNR